MKKRLSHWRVCSSGVAARSSRSRDAPTLRPATDDDFAFSETLAREQMAHYRAARGTQWDPARFRDSWSVFDNRVIEIDRRAVGVLRLLDVNGALEIRDLQVLPAYRGRGVGAWALAQAERMARARGLAELRLRVYPENPALALYERSGFERRARVDDVLHMCKWLPADERP